MEYPNNKCKYYNMWTVVKYLTQSLKACKIVKLFCSENWYASTVIQTDCRLGSTYILRAYSRYFYLYS